MPQAYCLYVDDSGTRHPDRQKGMSPNAHGGWFALGGLLIQESRVEAAEQRVSAFKDRWSHRFNAPLHSYDIRNRTGSFSWLATAPRAVKLGFMDELTEMITTMPIHVIACVVDRDGYNARYVVPYGRQRWKLCKTAFTILLERSVKVAQLHDSKLRVYVEKTSKQTDAEMRSYYEAVRAEGLPFDAGRSAQYEPLTPEDLRSTLYDFQLKDKKSRLMQIADLVLWPLCYSGYSNAVPAFEAMRQAGQLVESLCTPENGLRGTKYSCFDNVIKK